MATTVFPKPSGWASKTDDIAFTIAVSDWEAVNDGYQAEITDTRFNLSSIELVTYTASVADYLTANISKTKDAANHKLIFLTASLPTGSISGSVCCINNLSTSVSTAEKGIANGVASLDNAGKVPAQQLPSYVDDVLEYANQSSFPSTGESGKIYVAIDTSKAYRWSGSAYIELSSYETATQSASGLMSATDKEKLDGIATGATANVVSDSLSDTSATNALSAAKGKELYDQIGSLSSLGTSEKGSIVGAVNELVGNRIKKRTFSMTASEVKSITDLPSRYMLFANAWSTAQLGIWVGTGYGATAQRHMLKELTGNTSLGISVTVGSSVYGLNITNSDVGSTNFTLVDIG